MKLFGASLNQPLSLCTGVLSKGKSNLILIRREIQRLKVKPETQSLCKHPVCLTKLSEWGPRAVTQPSLDFPITHQGNTSTNNCSRSRVRDPKQHLWEKPQHGFSMAELWHWVNKCHCMSDHCECWGILVWSINAARLLKNGKSKTVWWVHEVLPKKMIPSWEMKSSL